VFAPKAALIPRKTTNIPTGSKLSGGAPFLLSVNANIAKRRRAVPRNYEGDE
jgi:hypothetical protein